MEIKDEGVCRFCLKTFSGAGMGRHLVACQAKQEADKDKEASEIKKIQSIIYHIKISGYKVYWLHIEVNSLSTLELLDGFLRKIWLECCGHFSSFEIKGVNYSGSSMGGSMFPGMMTEDISMDLPINQVLEVKDTFEYQYDFGSTTRLEGQVFAERRGSIVEPVRILARNNPFAYQCTKCGKMATEICLECDELFCDRCLIKHGGDEEMTLPVVNSPRMGVCGYCGDGDSDDFKVK